MFTDVRIQRGFTDITFNMEDSFTGNLHVERTPYLAMAHTDIRIQLPSTTNDPLAMIGYGMVVEPAILFALSMQKVADMLDIEHEAYPRLSKSTPITISVQGNTMMEIHAMQNEADQWRADLTIYSGPDAAVKETEKIVWTASDWSWSQMISLALAFPALSLIKMMGLVDDFRERMTSTIADMYIKNDELLPDLPAEKSTIRGFNLGRDSEDEAAEARERATRFVDTPAAQDSNQSDTPFVATDDEFDRAFKQLVEEHKKGGLNA